METIYLNKDIEDLYTSIETVVPIDGKQTRVRFELRFLEKTNKWYLSMFNSETGESYFRFVPMIGCVDDVNNLILPFSYKGTGFVICAAIIDNTDSVSPEKDNVSDFGIVWGDELVE